MKLHIFSDIHIDHYSDKGAKLLGSLNADADVAVLAGDIADGRIPEQWNKIFIELKKHYKHIIVTTGNHDYYNSTLERSHAVIREAMRGMDNIHFLFGSSVEIDGTTFHGHPMWYRYQEGNDFFENYMNDVRFIKDLNKWVYEENGLWEYYLKGKLQQGEVVITHHLPSPQSIAPEFRRYETNRFFLCDMTDLILERKPKLWIHGHSHTPSDYVLGETRVVCNPLGYPRERFTKADGYSPMEVEI